MRNFEEVRKDFPILSQKVHGKPLVYLDNAATSPVSVYKVKVGKEEVLVKL